MHQVIDTFNTRVAFFFYRRSRQIELNPSHSRFVIIMRIVIMFHNVVLLRCRTITFSVPVLTIPKTVLLKISISIFVLVRNRNLFFFCNNVTSNIDLLNFLFSVYKTAQETLIDLS